MFSVSLFHRLFVSFSVFLNSDMICVLSTAGVIVALFFCRPIFLIFFSACAVSASMLTLGFNDFNFVFSSFLVAALFNVPWIFSSGSLGSMDLMSAFMFAIDLALSKTACIFNLKSFAANFLSSFFICKKTLRNGMPFICCYFSRCNCQNR